MTFSTAGPGDDTLTGFRGADMEDGGPGNDHLDAPETSAASQAQAGGDTLIGGAGNDDVDYGSRRGPVAIRLDGQANDGESGEGDSIADDVEVVRGGDADDLLIGNAGPNVLEGRTGDDEIRGGDGDDTVAGQYGDDDVYGEGGNDSVEGGADSDLLDGGPGNDDFFGDWPCTLYACSGGNDTLQARDGYADAIACGVGADVAIVDQLDTFSSDLEHGCETVDRGSGGGSGGSGGGGSRGGSGGGGSGGAVAPALSLSAPGRVGLAALAKRGLALTVKCSAPCRIDAGLFVARKLTRKLRVPSTGRIGRSRATLPAAGEARIRIKLVRNARIRIKRVRAVGRLTLRVTAIDAAGRRTTEVRNVTIGS